MQRPCKPSFFSTFATINFKLMTMNLYKSGLLALAVLLSTPIFSQVEKVAISQRAIDQKRIEAADTGIGRKIVFQLTHPDPKVWDGLLRQLNNLKTGWPDAQMEVVVHSGGIGFLKSYNTEQASQIQDLSRHGVSFVACENTMKRKNLTPEDMIDIAGFVPMGIAEVVIKQDDGWAYIKSSP